MLGVIYGSWGVHVATVKEKFALDEARLSLALLAVALGGIAAMLRLGPWIARVGGARAVSLGAFGTCAIVALMLFLPSFAALLVLLLGFGVASAIVDVSINTEASALEKAQGRPLMSTMHAMFSVGGIAGAALTGLALARGMAPGVHFALVGAACALLVVAVRPALARIAAPMPEPDRAPARHRMPAALWALGLVASVAMIAEGAMYDWATVYMRETLHAGRGAASAGYAVFSLGMTAGRFGGDGLRARIGDARLARGGAALAAAGLLLALAFRFTPSALAGFALLGLGLANLIPVLFLAAARVEGVPAAESIARVAGLSYAGMLFGPVAIGFTAEATSLRLALLLIAACALVVALFAPQLVRSEGLKAPAFR